MYRKYTRGKNMKILRKPPKRCRASVIKQANIARQSLAGLMLLFLLTTVAALENPESVIEQVFTISHVIGESESKLDARKYVLLEARERARAKVGIYIEEVTTLDKHNEFGREITELAAAVLSAEIESELIEVRNEQLLLICDVRVVIDASVLKNRVVLLKNDRQYRNRIRYLQEQNARLREQLKNSGWSETYTFPLLATQRSQLRHLAKNYVALMELNESTQNTPTDIDQLVSEWNVALQEAVDAAVSAFMQDFKVESRLTPNRYADTLMWNGHPKRVLATSISTDYYFSYDYEPFMHLDKLLSSALYGTDRFGMLPPFEHGGIDPVEFKKRMSESLPGALCLLAEHLIPGSEIGLDRDIILDQQTFPLIERGKRSRENLRRQLIRYTGVSVPVEYAHLVVTQHTIVWFKEDIQLMNAVPENTGRSYHDRDESHGCSLARSTNAQYNVIAANYTMYDTKHFKPGAAYW